MSFEPQSEQNICFVDLAIEPVATTAFKVFADKAWEAIMEKKPGGDGLTIVFAVVGIAVCCALPVLLVTGGLGALAAWLFDGRVVWLLLPTALALVVLGLIVRYRRDV